MLRGARKYDPQTDSIVFATNHPFTMDNYVRAGLGNADLFRFCRRMTNMKVDNAEFALMTAIDIFSERYGLQVSSIMQFIQRLGPSTGGPNMGQNKPNFKERAI